MVIKMESTSFKEGELIPQRYTCDGDNISPPLRWDRLPEHTISLSIICEDPDAPGGIFTHWIISNLSPDIMNLDEGVKKEDIVENGAIQGLNDFGFSDYGGPCPPSGKTHRYFFKIYALDKILNIKPEFRPEEFLRAIESNIMDKGQLMGLYRRK